MVNKKNFNHKAFTILSLFLVLNFVKSIDEEFRVISLSHFDSEDSYLPIRPGTKFIIEAEGNPTTGYSWILEKPEKLTYNGILKALNLDKNNSGDYYQNPNPEHRLGVGGIYHFKFESTNDKYGMEKLEFVYKRAHSEEGSEKRIVNVNVVKTNDDL